MLTYFTIAICVLYIAFQAIKKERLYRPSILFATVWALVLFLYSLGLFEVPKVDDAIITIILCGLCSFLVGSFLSRMSKKRIVIGNYQLFSRVLRPFVLRAMLILFFVIMFLPVVRSTLLLMSGVSLYTIRYSLQNDILGSGIVAILFNYYCEPFLTFYIMYSVANLFLTERKAKNIILTIVGIAFMTIVSGGRFFIFYFIGAIGVCFLIYRKNIDFESIRNNKKTLNIARTLIVVAIVAIVVVSVLRGAEIGETIYIYFSGGVPFLEHLNEQFANQNTYGAATLYGFLRPIFVILRKIGICSFPGWLTNVESIFLSIDNPYYLAPGILFNSFSTSFFAPYLDGGFIGIIIFYFLLGYFCESIYKRLDINNEYSVCWFLLVSLIVLLSFFRLTITHYSFSLAFVYLIITHRHKQEQEDNS